MKHDLGYWLVKFNIVNTLEKAEVLCERGSVRIDGRPVSDMRFVPEEGSVVGTLESPYSYKIGKEQGSE